MSNDQIPRLKIEVLPSAAWLAGALPRLPGLLPPERLHAQRWFGSKARAIDRIGVRDVVPFPETPPGALALVDVTFEGGDAETYFLPLALRRLGEAEAIVGAGLAPVFSILTTPGGDFALYDGALDPDLARHTLEAMSSGRTLVTGGGSIAFASTAALPPDYVPASTPKPLRAEQSNSSVLLGSDFVLKFYRRLQDGPNPDLEVPRFLGRVGFAHTPPVAGYFEYSGGGLATTLGALGAFVANEGDGWIYALSHLRGLYARAGRAPAGGVASAPDANGAVREFSASFLTEMRRLGEITAELHLALASDPGDRDFAPLPVTAVDLESWREGMHAQLSAALGLARSVAPDYAGPERALLRRFDAGEGRLRARLDGLLVPGLAEILKIRHHGDYHLGQVLRTRDGFAILDFEGEPARPLAERRARNLALRDVAGMLRSFDYAAHAASLVEGDPAGDPAAFQALSEYGRVWAGLASSSFKEGYLLQAHGPSAPFLPSSAEAIDRALDVLALDKAIYELVYELNHRPTWAGIPLAAILRFVD